MKTRPITVNSKRNHMYVRRPLNAGNPFTAFRADGNPDAGSISKLNFGDSSGKRFRVLPYDIEDDYAEPVEIVSPVFGAGETHR